MIIFESIKLAFKAIWAHKSRSFLTILGILIGITSVVLLVSIGEGVKKDVQGSIEGLGSNFIFILTGNVTGGLQQNNGGTSSSMSSSQMNPAIFMSNDILTRDDVNDIKKIDGVDKAASMAMVSGYFKFDDKTLSSIIFGTEPDLQYVMSGVKLEKGRMVDQNDLDSKNQVIDIGSSVKKQIFGDSDAIGKKVTLVNKKTEDEYEVIGVFEKPTSSSLFSSDLDSLSIVPYTTAEKYTDDKEQIYRISVKAKDGVDVKQLSQKIKTDMLTRHKEEEFSVMTQDDMLGIMGTILNLLTTFISAIAAISLVVGGVGIMNIMLVSVTERTREIGLRKAVGATNGAILFQFLMEAVILSIFGGAISLGLVKIGVEVVKKYTSLTPVITLESILVSMAVCIGIGLVFGLAPAIQASRKNPIDALRYE